MFPISDGAARPGEAPAPHRKSGFLVRFLVRRDRNITVVRVGDTDWLAAAGNYVVIHAGSQTHVLRESLSALERKLDPAQFVRVSRSAVVNLDRVRGVETADTGEALVMLIDGTQLALTRGLREPQWRLEFG